MFCVYIYIYIFYDGLCLVGMLLVAAFTVSDI